MNKLLYLLFIIIILFINCNKIKCESNSTLINQKISYDFNGYGFYYVFDVLFYSDNITDQLTSDIGTITKIFNSNSSNFSIYRISVTNLSAYGSEISPTISSTSFNKNLGIFNFKENNDNWNIELISNPSVVFQSKVYINFIGLIKIINMNPMVAYVNPSISCDGCSLVYTGIGNLYYVYFVYVIGNNSFKQSQTVIINSINNIANYTFQFNLDDTDISFISLYPYSSREYYNSLCKIVTPVEKYYVFYDQIKNLVVNAKYPVEGVPGNATYLSNGFLPLGTSNTDEISIMRHLDYLGLTTSINNTISRGFVVGNLEYTTMGSTFTIDPYNGYSIANINYSINKTGTNFIEFQNNELFYFFQFPFGYCTRNSIGGTIMYNKQFSYVIQDTTTYFIFDRGSYHPNGLINDLNPPDIESFSLKTYDSKLYIMTIKVSDDKSGFKYFKYRGVLMTSADLIKGDVNNGTFEKIFNPIQEGYNIYNSKIYTMDFSGNLKNYNNSVYKIGSNGKISYFESPSIIRTVNVANITRFEFFNYNGDTIIDTTEKEIQMKLYFNMSNPKKDEVVLFTVSKRILQFEDFKYYYEKNELFQGVWNYTLKLYQVDFKIKKNQFTNSNFEFQLFFDYTLIYSKDINKFYPKSILNIYSQYADTLGPLVTNIENINLLNNTPRQMGYRFTLDVGLNKFKFGYVIIQSRSSLLNYNTSLFPSLSGINNQFDALFPIFDNYSSQSFYLNLTYLEDDGGYRTVSDIDSLLKTPNTSPFIYYSKVNDLIITNGTAGDDLLGPQLLDLNVSKPYQTFGTDSSVAIMFTFKDESGIDTLHNPSIYLTSAHFSKTIEFESSIVSANSDGSLTYKAVGFIPKGFGYPFPILINIYSAFDNFGNMAGFSSSQLKLLNLPYMIPINTMYIDKVYMTNASPINILGGLLTITGNSFLNDNNPVNIKIDYNTGYDEPIEPLLISSSVFILNIKPTEYQFTIKLFNSLGSLEDYRIVYPLGYKIDQPTTPPPTNPPPKCPGDQSCGGPSQGYCSSTGCICYSPWVGIDCTSKIIVITPPILNTTTPNTNITIPNDNENNSNEMIKSLISFVSLRELTIDGQIHKEHLFENWIFTNQSDSNQIKYLYSTTLDKDPNCQIDVLLQFFQNETIVQFANENITMSPSTLKYNVNITTYSFDSSLNTLLLVMSSSIQSNSNDNSVCSSKDFGIADSKNQYMTVQVDKYSLYGRFINRGVIDSRLQSISNVLLNDDPSLIDNSNSKLSKSYIGISIPNFRGIAQLDPDFSVLISSNSANSVCDKNGLTKGQIAGIVVGGAVFVCLVIIGIALLVKTTKGKIIINNIKLKKLKE